MLELNSSGCVWYYTGYQFKVAPPIVARTKVGRTKVAPHIVGPNQSWPGPKLSQPKVAPAQSWPSPKLSQL